MKAAAVDLGTVRVGLAVTDDLGWMAHPRPHLDGRSPGALLDALAELAAREGIEVFVVGLPRTLNGREGSGARRARGFARELAGRTGRRVELVDEWLTTQTAAARLRDGGVRAREARARLDSAAAAVLLQHWLDGRNVGGLP
ncbi:MAG: Holliday junction resolvase RuvX [Polyangiaceae bacterium]|nr:Holliday junction resolvase RuvX [Polyangiaceae bacterium]